MSLFFGYSHFVGVPQFLETVYTQASPNIARSLSTTPGLIELSTIFRVDFFEEWN
ncbi:MAG: hypothetical protein ACSNEK_08975 [Parachlamydiaceae bacterium]